MITLFMALTSAWAESPREILQKAINAQQIDNSIQTVEMIQYRNNAEMHREFELKIRREKDTLYSHTRFSLPIEIKGMQLARIDTPTHIDPVLIYLPALKTVRKANLNQLNKPFMGSDFSLADFEMNLSEHDQLDLIETSENKWVIQNIFHDNSVYSKLVATIDKESMLPLNIDYHDNRGHLKTLRITDVKAQKGRHIPMVSTMTNHRTGSKTKLTIKRIEVNVAKERIPLHLFTEEGLINEH